MTDDHHEKDDDRAENASGASPVEQITLVIEDVRALVRAELRYYQSRLDYSRYVMKWSLLFGAIAFLAFCGAAIALILGIVLTLAPHIGPGLATVTTAAGFSVIGLLSGVYAKNWLKKVRFTEIEHDDHDRT